MGFLFIPGTPVPQGSVKAFPVTRKNGRPGVVVAADNDNLASWRDTVRTAVRGEVGPRILYPRPQAVALGCSFVMPRRKAEKVNPEPHTRKPDIDKLLRAVLDALTGVLYEDDAQVVASRDLSKRTAEIGEQPGAAIMWFTVEDYYASLERELAIGELIRSAL